jgi:CMP-N-acetylneuraminic acid synthetase
MKIVVPVKSNSTRVPNKNFRPFFKEDSLYDLRMKKLIKVFNPSDIFVSSEDADVAKNAEKYGVNFILRDVKLTRNEIGMSEVIESITDQINLMPDEDFVWSQVTEPFFDEISESMELWEKNKDKFDSLVAVQRMSDFLINESGMPCNFHYGPWHRPSQELSKMYVLPFSFMVLKGEALRYCRYYIGQNPYLHEYKGLMVDIDDEEDFKLAQTLYNAISL